MFKYAKNKANTCVTIGPLKYNGKLTSDPQKLSKALNDHYVSTFSEPPPEIINQWLLTPPPSES